MIPLLYLSVPGRAQVLVNLSYVQTVQITDYGIDVYMLDPRASLCIECSPANAKSIFATIHNAVGLVNAGSEPRLPKFGLFDRVRRYFENVRQPTCRPPRPTQQGDPS